MSARRQVVLDTETTGLDWRTGDRVIEIGCIVMQGRQVTSERYHVYLNPERASRIPVLMKMRFTIWRKP